MSETAPLAIPCPACGQPLARVEVYDKDRVRFDLYRCQEAGCMRKVVVLFEQAGSMTPEEESMVKREIARRGAFFPSDMVGGSRFGRLEG